jgi:hypothetical protein
LFTPRASGFHDFYITGNQFLPRGYADSLPKKRAVVPVISVGDNPPLKVRVAKVSLKDLRCEEADRILRDSFSAFTFFFPFGATQAAMVPSSSFDLRQLSGSSVSTMRLHHTTEASMIWFLTLEQWPSSDPAGFLVMASSSEFSSSYTIQIKASQIQGEFRVSVACHATEVIFPEALFFFFFFSKSVVSQDQMVVLVNPQNFLGFTTILITSSSLVTLAYSLVPFRYVPLLQEICLIWLFAVPHSEIQRP